MTETSPTQSAPTPAPTTAPPAARWDRLWQVPGALAAVVVLACGLTYAIWSSPSPDFDTLLTAAERQLEAQQFAAALETLNDSIAPYAGERSFHRERRQRFHILRARAVYLGQSALGLSQPENYQTVIDEYTEAERLDGRLGPRDAFFLARAHIATGQFDKALARARTFGPDQRERRNTLLRTMVERKLRATQLDSAGTLDIIGEFLLNPALTVDDRAWAEAQQARLLARRGDYEEVVHRLLRAMPRMVDAAPEHRGALALRLGEAYLRLGALEDARANLEIAQRLLPGFGDALGHAVVLLGNIDELRGQASRARDRYQVVYERFGVSQAGLRALLSLAEVEASLGNDDRAAELYTELTAVVATPSPDRQELFEAASYSLLDRSGERAAAARGAEALRYALLAEQLHGLEQAPDRLLSALGEAHRLEAKARLEGLAPDHRGLHDLARLDVASRDQARRHYRAAGAYFRMLAGRVESDDERYAEAIWLSADSYDRAGDYQEAVKGFTEFIQGFDAHSGRAEARFRLGLALQALGRYDEAAGVFGGLIADAEDRILGKGVGPYATMSYVPLAQCYVLDGDAENDVEALELLARIARGEIVRRESQDYLTALIEYGTLLYQRARYPEAIEILSEAQGRLANDSRLDAVRFRLADAYRMEAGKMELVLEEAMPESERRRLSVARRDRLQRAIELFDEVRESLEAREDRLSALESVYLRNAYLYLGACAFDLDRFDEAVRHYSIAQERYPHDPASLAPMIQIVHAHLRRGEVSKAKAANARALRFYQSIPPQAWNDPTLPMTDREWERWHQLTTQLLDGVGPGPVTAGVDEGTG